MLSSQTSFRSGPVANRARLHVCRRQIYTEEALLFLDHDLVLLFSPWPAMLRAALSGCKV